MVSGGKTLEEFLDEENSNKNTWTSSLKKIIQEFLTQFMEVILEILEGTPRDMKEFQEEMLYDFCKSLWILKNSCKIAWGISESISVGTPARTPGGFFLGVLLENFMG